HPTRTHEIASKKRDPSAALQEWAYLMEFDIGTCPCKFDIWPGMDRKVSTPATADSTRGCRLCEVIHDAVK
ncbi:hypothetical protein BaRGS_00002082, partial [Batillaria attramentaria]